MGGQARAANTSTCTVGSLTTTSAPTIRLAALGLDLCLGLSDAYGVSEHEYEHEYEVCYFEHVEAVSLSVSGMNLHELHRCDCHVY